MASSFSATIGQWVAKIPQAIEAIMRDSAEDLVREINDEIDRLIYSQPPAPTYPKRTNFLRASLVASTEAMPQLVRDNPGVDVDPDGHMGPITLVINDWEGDQTLYLGVTASYGAAVHYGARGQTPKPWITLAAQKWPAIVAKHANRVKQGMGL